MLARFNGYAHFSISLWSPLLPRVLAILWHGDPLDGFGYIFLMHREDGIMEGGSSVINMNMGLSARGVSARGTTYSLIGLHC